MQFLLLEVILNSQEQKIVICIHVAVNILRIRGLSIVLMASGIEILNRQISKGLLSFIHPVDYQLWRNNFAKHGNQRAEW